MKCYGQLHGRMFAGNAVQGTFVNQDVFTALLPPGMPAHNPAVAPPPAAAAAAAAAEAEAAAAEAAAAAAAAAEGVEDAD